MLQMPESVNFILRTLAENGYEAYTVGGCVRDALLGKVPNDWDICTSARPDEIKACFSNLEKDVIGERYGTIAVHLLGERFEVTTFRTEDSYSDGRHPDKVTFTKSIEADLTRRDFTINAMAYSLETGLVDYRHGEEDLRHGIIRCVGDPDARFREDALRILRAIRFAASYRFHLDEGAAQSVHRNRELLNKVSQERLREEFCKLLVGPAAMRVCRDYRDVLAILIPEIKSCFDFKQNNPYHIFDVWEHTLHALDESDADLIVRLTVFFHDIGKPQCYFEDKRGGHFHGHGKISADLSRSIMQRLRFDGETIQKVGELVELHDRFIEVSEKAVRRLLNRLGPGQFDLLLKVRTADILGQAPDCTTQRLDKIANLRAIASRILSHHDCLSVKDLAVNGDDLLSLGYRRGPGIGEELRRLLDMVLENPEVNNRVSLCQQAEDDITKDKEVPK